MSVVASSFATTCYVRVGGQFHVRTCCGTTEKSGTLSIRRHSGGGCGYSAASSRAHARQILRVQFSREFLEIVIQENSQSTRTRWQLSRLWGERLSLHSHVTPARSVVRISRTANAALAVERPVPDGVREGSVRFWRLNGDVSDEKSYSDDGWPAEEMPDGVHIVDRRWHEKEKPRDLNVMGLVDGITTLQEVEQGNLGDGEFESSETRDEKDSSRHDSHKEIGEREMLRRAKISAANTGKWAWNKGRTHTEETKAKIREKTRQAMMRPEVRERLGGSGRPQSDETREKIRSRMFDTWAKRRAQAAGEKALLADWSNCIARAAGQLLGAQDLSAIGLAKFRRAAMRVDPEVMRARRKAAAEKRRTGSASAGEVVDEHELELRRQRHRDKISTSIRLLWENEEYRARVTKRMKENRAARESAAASTQPLGPKKKKKRNAASSTRRSSSLPPPTLSGDQQEPIKVTADPHLYAAVMADELRRNASKARRELRRLPSQAEVPAGGAQQQHRSRPNDLGEVVKAEGGDRNDTDAILSSYGLRAGERLAVVGTAVVPVTDESLDDLARGARELERGEREGEEKMGMLLAEEGEWEDVEVEGEQWRGNGAVGEGERQQMQMKKEAAAKRAKLLMEDAERAVASLEVAAQHDIHVRESLDEARELLREAGKLYHSAMQGHDADVATPEPTEADLALREDGVVALVGDGQVRVLQQSLLESPSSDFDNGTAALQGLEDPTAAEDSVWMPEFGVGGADGYEGEGWEDEEEVGSGEEGTVEGLGSDDKPSVSADGSVFGEVEKGGSASALAVLRALTAMHGGVEGEKAWQVPKGLTGMEGVDVLKERFHQANGVGVGKGGAKGRGGLGSGFGGDVYRRLVREAIGRAEFGDEFVEELAQMERIGGGSELDLTSIGGGEAGLEAQWNNRTDGSQDFSSKGEPDAPGGSENVENKVVKRWMNGRLVEMEG